jgi:tetratricopeptide (TPR) repeat protein
MKKTFLYLICLVLMSSGSISLAAIQSLIKEYTYEASELDSKISCRVIALEQVKRELLEELGTYVESTTVVRDYQIDKDEIRTLSAGVVQTKILDEKWNGRSFWLKAEVSADPDEVAASIEKLKNDRKLAEELAESQAEKDNALKEVERLKAELADAKADQRKIAQYNEAVNQLQAGDSFEQGTALTVTGDYEGAAKAFDRVIYYRPDDAKAFFLRSIAFIFMGNYKRAKADVEQAMLLNPAGTNVYFQRASAYKDIREQKVITKYSPVQPLPSRTYKPVPPKNDPLKNFLDKKQTENRFVRVTPFQPVRSRPIVKSTDRQIQTQRIPSQQQRQTVVAQPARPPDRIDRTVPPARTQPQQQPVRQSVVSQQHIQDQRQPSRSPTASLPQPLPRVGPCPPGYHVSGNACVASGPGTRPAMLRRGLCPSGYHPSGAYCLQNVVAQPVRPADRIDRTVPPARTQPQQQPVRQSVAPQRVGDQRQPSRPPTVSSLPPLPRLGPCPPGYHVSGNTCVASGPGTKPAMVKRGACPGGYHPSGAYCLRN